MIPQQIHQEVLIFKNTTLSRKVLCKKNGSATQDLEEACWHGLLNELVPEIIPSKLHTKMFIWEIHAGKFYVLIDLADAPGITESICSIDPHLFSSEIINN